MPFKSLGLSADLLRAVQKAGYDTPTPIQSAAIPPALDGRDLIGCAQTGTGKTAAFVLPMLDKLTAGGTAHSGRNRRVVRALVVTPTRELALQVETAIREYGAFTGLRSLAVFGGVSLHGQIKVLRQGVDIIVATPGRLLDHMSNGYIDLSQVEVLVLDEADRMFDMGFVRDIRKIVADTPRSRQTLLFSATMPPPIEELARSILTRPERIEIGHRRNPAESVTQHACAVTSTNKQDLLHHILENEAVENVIVFTRTKHRADRVTRHLSKRGFAATAIHSNRSQGQRQKALDGFRAGRFQVLVATDIAARGIDVDNVTHVINFDTPRAAEDYIHRIGRTGRAESTGEALTFVDPEEVTYLRGIEKHTGKALSLRAYDGLTLEHGEGGRSEGGSSRAPRGGRPSGSSNRPGRQNGRRSPSGRR